MTPTERKGGGAGLAVGVGLIGLGIAGVGIWALTAKAAPTPPSGKKKTTTTGTVSSTSILKGGSIDVDAELLDDKSLPMVGQDIYLDMSNSEQKLGTTDGQGQVHATLTFPLAGSFPIFLVFLGDAAYEASSSSSVTIIVSDPATTVHFEDFISDVTTETTFGRVVNFSGTLLEGTTPIDAADITIEHKDLKGKIAYSTGKTASDGTFSIPATMVLCGISPLDEIRNKAIYSGGGNVPDLLTGVTHHPDMSSSVVSPEIKVIVRTTIGGFGFRAADGPAQSLSSFEAETLIGSRRVDRVYHSAYVPGRTYGSNYYLEKVQSGGLIQVYSNNFNDYKFAVETSIADTVLGFKMRTQDALYGNLVAALVEPSMMEVRQASAKYAHTVTTQGQVFGLKTIPISATSVGSIMFWLVNKSSSDILLKVGYKQVAGGPTIPLYSETMLAGKRNSLQAVTTSTLINGVTHEGGTLRRVIVNDKVYSLVFESDIAGMSELEVLAEWIT